MEEKEEGGGKVRGKEQQANSSESSSLEEGTANVSMHTLQQMSER